MGKGTGFDKCIRYQTGNVKVGKEEEKKKGNTLTYLKTYYPIPISSNCTIYVFLTQANSQVSVPDVFLFIYL